MDSPQLGPAPAPAAEPLSPARARVAGALADLGPRTPLVTLVRHLGGHPNATRQHLEALVGQGHATVEPLPSGGRGRPARAWTLTASGRRALSAQAGDSAYAALVDALASRLASQPDATVEAHAIGRVWGARQAGDGRSLVEVLDELGFTPVPDEESPGTTRLVTCPILDSARQHPEVICAIHQGLVEGALGPDAGVRLRPFAEPGACLLTTGQGGARLG